MATPPIIWRGLRTLLEQSNSPSITFGEEIRMTRIFRAPYSVALGSAPGKGALGVGAAAGLRVREATVQHEKAGIGLLTIEYESIPGQPYENVPLPPTTEQLERSSNEFSVTSHPLFASLDDRTLSNVNTLINTAPSDPLNEQAFEELATLPQPQKATSENLYRKLRKGITFYRQYPPEFVRTSYHWDEPLNPSGGGYIETPVPFLINIPAGFQWLREADSVEHNGTFYVLREKWTGGKNIEADLYQQ